MRFIRRQVARSIVGGVGRRFGGRWLVRITTGVAVACVFAAGPGLSSASAAGKSCAVRGSKTLHLVQNVRIYAFQSHLYACSSRYGRKVFLFKSRYVNNGEPALGAYAQSGQTVLAYVLWPSGRIAPGQATLVSRNLRTGAVLRHYLACGPDCGANVTITRLVTNSKGSFAWINDSEGPGSITDTSVNEDDSSGYKLLDDEVGGAPCMGSGGPTACHEMIDVRYLVAANGMVSWKGGSSETLQSASFN
jgi:hypothetical protein